MLQRVRCKLVHQETERRRHARRQGHLRSGGHHLLRTLTNERLEQKLNQGGQVGTSPITGHQQFVRAAKGVQSCFETVERVSLGTSAQRLPSHRVHNAEHVLDEVGQLAKEQFLADLQLLAIYGIEQCVEVEKSLRVFERII